MDSYLLITNTTCLSEANANVSVIKSFNELGYYDLYVISRILYFTTMTELTLVKRLFSNYYLGRYCKYEAHCDKEEAEGALMMQMAKFAFFSWLPDLPENDFGTSLANHVISYVGFKGKEGFDTFVKATLGVDWGDNWLHHFALEDNVFESPHPNEDDVVERPHPNDLMRIFIPNYAGKKTWTYNNTIPRNFTRMAKLLLYSGFTKSYAREKKISVSDVVKLELNNYPYLLRDDFIVRNH